MIVASQQARTMRDRIVRGRARVDQAGRVTSGRPAGTSSELVRAQDQSLSESSPEA